MPASDGGDATSDAYEGRDQAESCYPSTPVNLRSRLPNTVRRLRARPDRLSGLVTMWDTLILGGLALIGAAIVGGGIKLFQVEVPHLASVRRQILLALFGGAIALGGAAGKYWAGKSDMTDSAPPAEPWPAPPNDAPTTPDPKEAPTNDAPKPRTKEPEPVPVPPERVPDPPPEKEEADTPRQLQVTGDWYDAQGDMITIKADPEGYFRYADQFGFFDKVRGGWELNGSVLIVFAPGKREERLCELTVADNGQTMSGVCSMLGLKFPVLVRRSG